MEQTMGVAANMRKFLLFRSSKGTDAATNTKKLLRLQFGHTHKNSKKKEKKNQKNEKITPKKKRKRVCFPVVLYKMCIFCLFPIPDSQQCVKRGSCRCPILSGVLVSFYCLLDFGLIYVQVRVWVSNLFHYVVYLFYQVFESFRINVMFRANFHFISNCCLCLNVVSYRAVFLMLIFFYVKSRSIFINYVS